MDFVNKVFGIYDKMIAGMPLHYQALLSLGVLIFFLWIVYIFIKNKSWFFLVVILLLLPETLPAARNVGIIILNIFKGLILRIKGL